MLTCKKLEKSPIGESTIIMIPSDRDGYNMSENLAQLFLKKPAVGAISFPAAFIVNSKSVIVEAEVPSCPIV